MEWGCVSFIGRGLFKYSLSNHMTLGKSLNL